MNFFEWMQTIVGIIVVVGVMAFGKTSEEYEKEGGGRSRY